MPANQTTPATSVSGAVVSYTLPMATDNLDPAPVVECSHASDSTFPIGMTTVTCAAIDASGNAVAASFTAKVHYPFQNQVDPLFVNDDLFVTPVDVLVIINEINVPTISFEGGLLPLPALSVTFFYDVNGDGFVTPIDPLLVINFLNAPTALEGEAIAPESWDKVETAAGLSVVANESFGHVFNTLGKRYAAPFQRTRESQQIAAKIPSPPPAAQSIRDVSLRHSPAKRSELDEVIDELTSDVAQFWTR